MQTEKATELQRKWGGKPCDHPSFDNEYYLGGSTGDYVCTTCGEVFMPDEYRKIIEERKQSAEAKHDSSS